jgi:hypothetical protein
LKPTQKIHTFKKKYTAFHQKNSRII